MTKVIHRTEIFKEGDCYVALCPELDVSSFGDSPEDAKDSLHEAVEAFIEGCEYLGTLDEVLQESGFELTEDTWKLRQTVDGFGRAHCLGIAIKS